MYTKESLILLMMMMIMQLNFSRDMWNWGGTEQDLSFSSLGKVLILSVMLSDPAILFWPLYLAPFNKPMVFSQMGKNKGFLALQRTLLMENYQQW